MLHLLDFNISRVEYIFNTFNIYINRNTINTYNSCRLVSEIENWTKI